MVSPDHLSPTPTTFSAMKAQKTQKRTMVETSRKKDILNVLPFQLFVQPKYRSSNKK
jgi:hypothetical protein